MWQVVEDFLMEEQFSTLSQYVLIHLAEQRLLRFLKTLGKLISPNAQCTKLAFPCCWLEVLLSAHIDQISLGCCFGVSWWVIGGGWVLLECVE